MKKDNLLIECACGCGQLRPKYDKRGKERRYISGHNSKGKTNPFFEKKHTELTREKMSKNHPDVSGEKGYFFGKHHTEEAKRKNSDAHIGNKQSEETRRKIRESEKGEKNSFYGKNHTEETKKKISENNGRWNLGKHISEKTKEKISLAQRGEKAHNWQGGISFEPYCPKFNEAFKETIREEFDRVCFLCPTTEEENGRKLSVHHVNYNKNCLCDDSECEFVPLCASCHGKTNNGNREYWEESILQKLGVIL